MNRFISSLKSPVFLIPFCLSSFGLLFLSISSLSEAYTTTGDQYYFIKKQALWIVIGLITMQFFKTVKLNFIKKLSSFFYLLSIFLLFIVLIPSLSQVTLGARRWINFGTFGFQPSELIKLTAIIFFAKIFSNPATNYIKYFLAYLILPLGLILIEPSLSNALIIFLIISLLFYISNGNIFKLCFTWLISLLLIVILILIYPYRLNRFISLLKPNNSIQNPTAYHNTQLNLAISTGGLTGKGLANSDQKYLFIPKISTDSIFAVIAEETGFIGCTITILSYLILINHLFKLSSRVEDKFSLLFVYGIACLIGLQTIINLAAIVSLVPITGVPLPFISYGGSSLLILFIGLGIVQNIESQILLYSNYAPDENKQKNRYHRHTSYSGHRTHLSTSTR